MLRILTDAEAAEESVRAVARKDAVTAAISIVPMIAWGTAMAGAMAGAARPAKDPAREVASGRAKAHVPEAAKRPAPVAQNNSR